MCPYTIRHLNYASNCFSACLILHIWPPATLIYFQAWGDGSKDRDFHQIKRSNAKPMAILEVLTNRITRDIEYRDEIGFMPKKFFCLCHPTEMLNSLSPFNAIFIASRISVRRLIKSIEIIFVHEYSSKLSFTKTYWQAFNIKDTWHHRIALTFLQSDFYEKLRQEFNFKAGWQYWIATDVTRLIFDFGQRH